MFVPLTPIEFKHRAERQFGTKIGVVDGERRFTYMEFGQRCNRLANGLLEAGLELGDRVAYLAYNSHPLLEGYFGVLQAGGILFPLNVRLAPGELAFILNDAGVRFLVLDPDFAPLFEAMRPDLTGIPQRFILGAGHTEADSRCYEDMLAAASIGEPPALDIDENDVAELFYTSGTTGRPKGVMLTHRNLYLHAFGALTAVPFGTDEVQLHTIPLFHVNGWGTPQSLTALGGTHVMLRKFDPADVLRLVQQERVTRFLVVPAMLNMILNHPDIGRYDVSSLRFISVGGSPTPRQLIRTAQAVLGCEVLAGYGLSETSPVLTCSLDKSHLDSGEQARADRHATAGFPVIGVDVQIVDEKDRELPWDGNSVGEVVARSNVVMAGYWNDPEGTDAVIRDGWFHTGDMGSIDSDGYLSIVDRKKDIIISGGENISSAEVEKLLFEHPAVLEVAIIGVPDEKWGEVPKALVTLKPGASATQEELIQFCRDRIAGFKVPRSVEFFDTLPKGGTGKILKAKLREPYWASRPTNVN